MGHWKYVIISVLVLLIAGMIYMVKAVGKFAPFKNFRKKIVKYGASFAVIVLLMILCSWLLGTVNAVIVFLHALFFFIFADIAVRIAEKVRKKKAKFNISGWIAIISCTVYLAVGYYLCINVWETDYTIHTDKLSEDVSIALIADCHIGSTFDGEGFAAHIETIKEQNPDIVIIAGDFVDDDTDYDDLKTACRALGTMEAKYGVWFSYGNHDKGYYNSRGFSAEDLENELEKNGVHVLEDEYEYVGELCIVGRADKLTYQRKDIFTMLEGVDTDRYVIVIDHEPADYDNESKSGADLVLSGHTHGGQFFPINNFGSMFGIDDKTYGHEKRGSTDFIVTSGIADWSLKFKTGTKSEYVIINLVCE